MSQLLHQHVLSLAEFFLGKDADVTFGKRALSSGLCPMSLGNAEPVTVNTAGVMAKMLLEKLDADGSSFLDSKSWLLPGWGLK